MKRIRKYNGHPNWTYWNLSLWFGNDQNMYNAVMLATNKHTFYRTFAGYVTPDGAKLSRRSAAYVFNSFHKG